MHVGVFDGVAGLQDARLFQAGDGADEFFLDPGRKAGRDSVGVEDRGAVPLRLQEDGVGLAVCEAHHLVLQRRTVTRTLAMDSSCEHGRFPEMGTHDRMGDGVGVRAPAGDLGPLDAVRQEGEGGGFGVAALFFKPGQVRAVGRDPRRGSGLEAGGGEFEGPQSLPQPGRPPFPHPSPGALAQALVQRPFQERARGQDHRPGGNPSSVRQLQAADPPSPGHGGLGLSRPGRPPEKTDRLAFQDPDSCLSGYVPPGGLLIGAPVALAARGLDGPPLARVQQAELDAGLVGQKAHAAAQGVHLAGELSLADPSDGRIAGHAAQGRCPQGDQNHAKPEARGGGGGFQAGVPSADNGHVEGGRGLPGGEIHGDREAGRSGSCVF